MFWTLLIILILLLAAYHRMPLILTTMLVGIGIMAVQLFSDAGAGSSLLMWIVFAAVFVPLNVRSMRQQLVSRHALAAMTKVMPTISQTEQEALDAGDTWYEAEIFNGNPDFDVIRKLPKPQLTDEEQAYLDGPVEQLCEMLDDWQITHEDYNLSEEVWQFIKDNKLFAMIIPKQYGGLDYSALLHSEVVMKIASRSGSAGVTVMVPNSLGPGKLLMAYGTEAQKDHYLPRLASGEDVPCFGLTGPVAGSDAGSMPDNGVVCYGHYDGQDNVLGIRLNFEKRYITLAPVATVLGVAFKLFDPDHLLGEEEDIGITLALLERDIPGIEIGNRHMPANQAFMNGPIRGRDVFIPMEKVIGGQECIGKGWSMLMECLTDGRAISLPAMSTSAAKIGALYTGAYARTRSQFNTPIGYFEGIEEALAVIGGQAYALEASRLLILSALDNHCLPSVISGVVKQQTTERMRVIVNTAMDVHGGHGICMGPNNHLGRAYQLIPVGITVEGANILTRSLIIFGQGAMRSHPYLLKEVEAVHMEDKGQGLKLFDDALFKHIGLVISNLVRSVTLGLTMAKFTRAPGSGKTKHYYQQLKRTSASFSLLTDVCLSILGGSLKRREMLSGRLADALSNQYVLSAVLKKYEDDGCPEADLPLVRWAADDALNNIEIALKGVLKNLPVPVIGRVLSFLLFPFGQAYHKPDDHQTHKVARLLLEPSDTLDRLAKGIFISDNPAHSYGRVLHARNMVIAASPLQKKIREAQRDGDLPKSGDIYATALEKGILSQQEIDQLHETQAAVSHAVKVDEFSHSGWEVRTP